MEEGWLELLKIRDYELLNSKVYKTIKRAIVRGDIKSNSNLSLLELSKLLDVSVTPVREAVNKLESEGFLKKIPNKGIKVIKIDIHDMREILEIRAFMDGLMTKLATKKIKEREIEELTEILRKMEKTVINDDRLAYNELDIQFHDVLLLICGNNRLKEISDNLKMHAHRFRIRTLSIPGRMSRSYREHCAIVDAIKEREPEKANKLSQIHVENILRSIEEDEKKKKISNIKLEEIS